MNTNSLTEAQHQDPNAYDLFRLSKSKDVVDICSNTLRAYFKAGLKFYRRGKAVFVSKRELAAFIRGAA